MHYIISSKLRNQQAPNPVAQGKVLKKDDHQKVKDMMKSIEDEPNCEPFLEPVQWQGTFSSISFPFRTWSS